MRSSGNLKTNRCYHLISRVAHKAFFLDDEEKPRLVDFLWRAAEFSGVVVIAYGVMRLLSEGDLRERHGVTSRSYFTLRNLSPLVASGYVEMTDPSHPRSSAQSYRLTARGRKIID